MLLINKYCIDVLTDRLTVHFTGVTTRGSPRAQSSKNENENGLTLSFHLQKGLVLRGLDKNKKSYGPKKKA